MNCVMPMFCPFILDKVSGLNPNRKKVLFVTSEFADLVKTGGLGDVSAALPHAVRRFEFMVMPGETEAELSKPENLRKLLAKVLPNPDRIELIRSRVYTHNARLAAGDAARADGIVVTPSHNPPDAGGFKYNPPNGGPADTEITSWIEKQANALLADSLRVPLGRLADAVVFDGRNLYDPARLRQRERVDIQAVFLSVKGVLGPNIGQRHRRAALPNQLVHLQGQLQGQGQAQLGQGCDGLGGALVLHAQTLYSNALHRPSLTPQL